MLESSHQGHHQANHLLAAMPPEAFDLMAHDLSQVTLEQGQPIYEAGAPVEQIYFPQSGMISLQVVTNNGNVIETGIVGREGAVGLHAALGKRLAFTRATTQIGGQCSKIHASKVAQSVQQYPAVREMIGQYTEVLWAEAQQISACNAIHDAPARFCRWLLQSADRSGSDNLLLTQELMAEMLGVRRTTVTLLAQNLKSKNAIDYSRGRLRILNREHLEHSSCECYAVMHREKLPLKIGVKF
jgi:CRP-like cAMP-binding protein